MTNKTKSKVILLCYKKKVFLKIKRKIKLDIQFKIFKILQY